MLVFDRVFRPVHKCCGIHKVLNNQRQPFVLKPLQLFPNACKICKYVPTKSSYTLLITWRSLFSLVWSQRRWPVGLPEKSSSVTGYVHLVSMTCNPLSRVPWTLAACNENKPRASPWLGLTHLPQQKGLSWAVASSAISPGCLPLGLQLTNKAIPNQTPRYSKLSAFFQDKQNLATRYFFLRVENKTVENERMLLVLNTQQKNKCIFSSFSLQDGSD